MIEKSFEDMRVYDREDVNWFSFLGIFELCKFDEWEFVLFYYREDLKIDRLMVYIVCIVGLMGFFFLCLLLVCIFFII